MQLAGGKEVKYDDAWYVRKRIVAIATASARGGFHPTMTSDPNFVSKAIFGWGCIHRGNHPSLAAGKWTDDRAKTGASASPKTADPPAACPDPAGSLKEE